MFWNATKKHININLHESDMDSATALLDAAGFKWEIEKENHPCEERVELRVYAGTTDKAKMIRHYLQKVHMNCSFSCETYPHR